MKNETASSYSVFPCCRKMVGTKVHALYILTVQLLSQNILGNNPFPQSLEYTGNQKSVTNKGWKLRAW